MSFLLSLADGFFKTFGITQPTQAARRRAALFLLVLLVVALVLVATIGWLFFTTLHHI